MLPGFKCKCKMCGSTKTYSWEVTATQCITQIYRSTNTHLISQEKQRETSSTALSEDMVLDGNMLPVDRQLAARTECTLTNYMLLYFM